MPTDPKSQPDLLNFLQEQIKRRESFRQEIDHSIEILRQAEKELRRILPGAEPPSDEAPDDLPYRIQPEEAREARRPPAPRPRWEEPAPPAGGPASPLERPLSSLRGRPEVPRPEARERAPLPEPLDLPHRREAPPIRRGVFARGVDETLQDEQMLLLGVDDLTSSRRGAASEEMPPREKPLFRLDEETPAPSAAPEHPAPVQAEAPTQAPRPAAPGPRRTPAPISPSVQKLMDYIRLGGAVRCIDPWGRTCAAFVFRANGSAVFATDVFVNYLRTVLSRMKPERPDDLASGLQRESVPQIRFLASLVEALRTQRLLSVRAVKGLQLSGGQKLPSGFEFEASTRDLMHPTLLERLQAVLQKPPMSFFLPEGPYAEVRGYLTDYQAFCRQNGDESRAAAMLIQIGLEEASPAPPSSPAPASQPAPQATPGGKTLADVPPPPSDTGVFMDESEELQDLNTFDFSPEDQKNILSQKEDVFSMSTFKRSADQPMERPASGPDAEESSTSIPGPAANRAEGGRKDDQIRNFLKDIGVEWKG